MSLFNDTLGVSPDVRRRLFWLVCIWVRLTLAITAWAVIVQYADAARYAVGGTSIAAGVFFAIKALIRESRNKQPRIRPEYEAGLWWYRSFHAFVWILAGGAAFALHSDDSTAGLAVMSILIFDVLFGSATAYYVEPFDDGLDDSLFSGRWTWAAPSETQSKSAVVTWWTIVHFVLTSSLGVGAYYASPSEPWLGCVGATLIVFLWEAFENSCTGASGQLLSVPARILGVVSCRGDPGPRKKTPDSAFNLLGDLVVGISCVWAAAYIAAAVAE